MESEPQKDAELKALSEALHELYDPVLGEPVPERLRIAGGGSRWRGLARAAGFVAVGAALGALAAWQLRGERAPLPVQAEAPAFVKRAAIAHATYSPEVRHPVEVGADQEAHLVAWLSKRLGAPVRAPKLEEVGYSLVGGRLLPGDSGPVAQFMYQCKQGTRVTLYVRTDGRENRETAFRYQAEGNVKVFYWIDRRFGYALSSADIPKERLLAVAEAVYRQLNPE
ncbi:MAG: anti-sigma factor [Pseudomonadota bacterium]